MFHWINLNNCAFVVAVVVLLMLLGCQTTSESGIGHRNVPLLTTDSSLDTEEIRDDFRRLRKGCALTITGPDESPGIGLGMVLSEFSQADEALFRRLFPEGTQMSYLAQRVSLSSFCEFKGIELITNFFANLTFQQALEEHLATQPTTEDLAAELDGALNAVKADPKGLVGDRFNTVFAIPEHAVFASVQLVCPNCNVRLGRRVRERVMDEWLTRIALDPEKYQSWEGTLGIFEEFRLEGRWSPQ